MYILCVHTEEYQLLITRKFIIIIIIIQRQNIIYLLIFYAGINSIKIEPAVPCNAMKKLKKLKTSCSEFETIIA